MATNITMPQLGESVTEGTIGKWLKQPGDAIAKYEPLVEVITDKVNSEIPSPAAGVLLAIHVPEGETVRVGSVIALIGAPGEEVPAAAAGRSARAPPHDATGCRLFRSAGAPGGHARRRAGAAHADAQSHCGTHGPQRPDFASRHHRL